MKISIDSGKTVNHLFHSDDEIFEILRESVKTLNNMYERISESDDFNDDECNRVYNIIDILWDIERV